MGSSRKTHPIYPDICENFAANIVDFEESALLTFPDYPLTYRSLITIVTRNHTQNLNVHYGEIFSTEARNRYSGIVTLI